MVELIPLAVYAAIEKMKLGYPCNNCKTAEAFKGMPVSCRDLCKEWEKWQGAKVTCPGIEPKIHSHIEDSLPNSHPLASKCIYCRSCGGMLHADNNECMQTWVETGKGNFCIKCFGSIPDVDALEIAYGLICRECGKKKK